MPYARPPPTPSPCTQVSISASLFLLALAHLSFVAPSHDCFVNDPTAAVPCHNPLTADPNCRVMYGDKVDSWERLDCDAMLYRWGVCGWGVCVGGCPTVGAYISVIRDGPHALCPQTPAA